MRSWGAPFPFSTSRHIGQTGPCLCITTSSGPGIPLPAHARAGVTASRRRRAASFPTIGKYFRRFSNDWKKISAPSPAPRHAAPAPRPPFGRGRQTAESTVRQSKSITPASYRFPRRHRKGESSPRGKSRRGRAEARPSPRRPPREGRASARPCGRDRAWKAKEKPAPPTRKPSENAHVLVLRRL